MLPCQCSYDMITDTETWFFYSRPHDVLVAVEIVYEITKVMKKIINDRTQSRKHQTPLVLVQLDPVSIHHFAIMNLLANRQSALVHFSSALFDIRAPSRSVLSVRVPGCQTLGVKGLTRGNGLHECNCGQMTIHTYLINRLKSISVS